MGVTGSIIGGVSGFAYGNYTLLKDNLYIPIQESIIAIPCFGALYGAYGLVSGFLIGVTAPISVPFLIHRLYINHKNDW